MTLLRPYAFIMLFVNLGFILVNLTGLFPITLELGGVQVIGNMNDDVTQLQTTFQSASSGLDYLQISGYVIFIGGKLIIQFFAMAFLGFGAILDTIGFPAAITAPISVVLGAILLYELGMLLMGRD